LSASGSRLKGVDLERISRQEIEQVFEQVVWDPYEELLKRQGREQQEKAPAQTKELLESARPVDAELPLIAVAHSYEQITAAASALKKQGAELGEQIIAQVDEVVVRKQPGSKREKIVHYNGVIKASDRSYYCSSPTSAELIYQMGSILAQLEVHTSSKRLLVLSDCASWINNWVSGIGINDKEAIMCWHHLRDRCRELIGEAFTNKPDRDEVRKVVLKYLWRGQTDKALSYLKKLIEDVEDGCSKLGVKSVREIERIKDYLIKRQAYIVDYQTRVKNREWIASTQVEKFNDFSVSMRCKKENGMRWSSSGVGAIAAIEAARRNGELEEWRENGKLPSWEEHINKAA
jgi:hypothetical protein